MMPRSGTFSVFRLGCERAWACRWFLVGNDIIDLQYLEWPPYQHIRYLERVCTPSEADAVRGSRNPARSLAAVWGAKEASFKLLSRARNLMHFVPREFVTDFAHRNSAPSCDELWVSHQGTQASVSIFETTQWLHAVARFPRCRKLQWRVREIGKDSCHEANPADESIVVRQLAKELILVCGMKNVVLDSVGRIPTLRDAGPLGREKSVSLSHHGRFVAAAIAWTASELSDQEETIGSLAPGASSRAA